jgi:broad specificity phosphatase PhoE
MTVFFLIRHGAHDLLGHILVGRGSVALNDEGRHQAQWLAERLAAERLTAVASSPRQRTRETAEPIARRHGLPVTLEPALDEVDSGDWTGRSFADLARDPLWQRYNRLRSTTRIPGGEMMLEVQARVVDFMEATRQRAPEGRIALVSHGDVIRGALLLFLAMPADAVHRLTVEPGSLSVVMLGDGEPQVLQFNERAAPASTGSQG